MSLGEFWPGPNLKALYHLSAVTDSSGNGYNLSEYGSPTYSAGKLGNAVNISTSNFVKREDAAGVYLGSDFTICCLVKYSSMADADYIFDVRSGSAGQYCMAFVDSDGSLSVLFGGSAADTGVNLSAGVWYELAFVRSGSSGIVYLDGRQIYTGSIGTGGNTASLVYIGYRYGVSDSYMQGQVDEFVIIQRAFTAQEIRRLRALRRGMLV